MGECDLDLTGSAQEQVTGSCEHGNEPSCFIKYGEFLTSFSSTLLT